MLDKISAVLDLVIRLGKIALALGVVGAGVWLFWPSDNSAKSVTARAVSRSDLMVVVRQHSDLTIGDFESYVLTDGRVGFKAQKPHQGLLLSFIGPQDNVSEVVAVVGVNKETFLRHELLLTALAITAAKWDDGFTTVPQVINELAQANGGKRHMTINGHAISIGVAPPNLISLDVVRH